MALIEETDVDSLLTSEEVPQNIVAQTKYMRIIQMLKERQEQNDIELAQFVQFYNKQATQIAKQVEYIQGQLQKGMEQMDTKTLRTPIGTASMVTRKSVTWPPDEVLINWAKENAPSDYYPHLIRTTTAPNKTGVKELMAESKLVPPGYLETPVTKLEIKWAPQKEKLDEPIHADPLP